MQFIEGLNTKTCNYTDMIEYNINLRRKKVKKKKRKITMCFPEFAKQWLSNSSKNCLLCLEKMFPFHPQLLYT